MKTIIRILSASAFVATVTLSSCVSDTVATRPAEPVVVVPASPGPNYVWVNGAWHYNRPKRAYVYREGYWVVPARPGRTWVDGHWIQTSRGWRYVKGHWR
ncbi:MAG: YXWGXW repeat-containing protein [Cyclobacteriaceae bacterium]|nr:YXWGXW repeat-containing protein [Cyclobacteriaceae bacterium]